MASGPIMLWQIEGETLETVTDFIFVGFNITADADCNHEVKLTCSMEQRPWLTQKAYQKAETSLRSQRSVYQREGCFSSHIWTWLLDHKESWGLKNWCFWTVVVEKTLESPLACKEIKPVNPNGNQSWLFTRRTDIVAETPVLCPPDAKHWLIGKDSDAGKEWRPEEKDMTEDEMVGWHRRFEGLEFQQALGVGDGQGSLVCCSPWGCTESCREPCQALLTKWRHGPKPLSFSQKHGPGMKELGLVILTCSFLSLAELTKKEY